jgi:threonyl-tRNA synthetase
MRNSKQISRNSCQEKQPFERIVLTKNEALDLFADNPFKVELIKAKVPEEGYTSAYRCGNLIDLCTGPHIQSSDRVKGFAVTANSSAYWLADNKNGLQRVYAISFPKHSLLKEYQKEQKELEKRKHTEIGPKQGLFNFSELAPGCAFFYPDGTKIYNRLMTLMREEYRIRGYQEVITPNMYNQELWKISGHFFKYKDNMYLIHQDEDEVHGLKPMNCPGHCLMFDMIQRSYRDLPIRFADFGVLHRNESKDSLSELIRVRRFQQDDGHIFCMPDQIESEILAVLDFIDYIYSLFDFKYKLQLSTRPEQYLGNIEDWNKAEQQLENALKQFGKEYKINPGDGAFYGPKINVKLFDAMGREHQCGTVQLDFQLPLRFNLQYRHKGEAQVPKQEVAKEEGHQEEGEKKKGKKEHKKKEQKKEEERK